VALSVMCVLICMLAFAIIERFAMGDKEIQDAINEKLSHADLQCHWKSADDRAPKPGPNGTAIELEADRTSDAREPFTARTPQQQAQDLLTMPPEKRAKSINDLSAEERAVVLSAVLDKKEAVLETTAMSSRKDGVAAYDELDRLERWHLKLQFKDAQARVEAMRQMATEQERITALHVLIAEGRAATLREMCLEDRAEAIKGMSLGDAASTLASMRARYPRRYIIAAVSCCSLSHCR
jgi:Mg/Co/Ni transporter MgtE